MTLDRIHALAQQIVQRGAERGVLIAIAESCTGGMAAAAITDIPGSSAVLDCGFVTYSYESKTEMLGVPTELLQKHGAVSGEVVEAMAKGAIARSRAHISVSVTGIAGPAGGTAEKPVGLVWFGRAVRDGPSKVQRRIFEAGPPGPESREAIRRAATETALEMLMEAIDDAAHFAGRRR